MDHPNSFRQSTFGLKAFLLHPGQNIVFCGDKSIIRADFMIDDNIPNLKAFVGQGIVFTAPSQCLRPLSTGEWVVRRRQVFLVFVSCPRKCDVTLVSRYVSRISFAS